MKLVPPYEDVFVAYTWAWIVPETSGTMDDDTTTGTSETVMQNDESDDEEEDEPDRFDTSFITHTVVFKCIGANRDENHQSALRMAARAIKNGSNVPVKLEREPDNPKDSNAIAFHCYIEEDWRRIGYVVKEALADVDDALKTNKILSVKFAWVKFLLCWSHSGPGYYAGISISKQGDWSRNVTYCASTK